MIRGIWFSQPNPAAVKVKLWGPVYDLGLSFGVQVDQAGVYKS